MARIRTIKPEFWSDEKLARMAPLTRLVFLGLVSQADDAGRLVDNVKLIDGLLFPDTEDSCRGALEELATANRIERYASESGQRLIQVVNWKKHQNVQHPSSYVLPAPPVAKVSGKSHEEVTKDSSSDLGAVPVPVPTFNDHGAVATRAGGEDWIGFRDECVAFVREAGYGPTEVMIAGGEDKAAWMHPVTGEQVPWGERLRLLKLADAHLKGGGKAKTLRAAINYVRPQQLDPIASPTSADFAERRRMESPQPVVGPTLETAADREARREADAAAIREWTERTLRRFKQESAELRELLEREAVEAVGELTIRNMPASARPKIIQAKMLELYGAQHGDPQPELAA